MGKAVLISIRPKWCELIAQGEKTIEVRKTAPKLPTPFKCYIYETQGSYRAGNEAYNFIVEGSGRRKVIGEFICDAIWMLAPICHAPEDIDVEHLSQLSREQIVDYVCDKGYGWHISDLVIYKTPKPLDVFCRWDIFNYTNILRPPQSWMYVEEL